MTTNRVNILAATIGIIAILAMGPAAGAGSANKDKTPDAGIADLRRNAASGHAGAQFTLAILYLSGRLGDDKRAEAVPLLLASAEQKHNGALFVLGSLHEHGTLVPRDLPRAVSYYRLPAAPGDTKAQNALGQCLRHGARMPPAR